MNKMIIVSSRKKFSNADKISKQDFIKEISLTSHSEAGVLSMQELCSELQGKSVLLLVHGYNNEQIKVHEAYKTILDKINTLIPNLYDTVIGYSWPGGDQFYDWWWAKSRANDVAIRFRLLIEKLSPHTAALDVMSHSLSARVCFGALKKSQDQELVRNYFCTAPAIDHESLEPEGEFYHSFLSCGRLFVLHSIEDGILRILYEKIENEIALGLHGPEDKDYISRRSRTIYVANCKKVVDKHGGYKRTDRVYQYIGTCHASNPPKFKTL